VRNLTPRQARVLMRALRTEKNRLHETFATLTALGLASEHPVWEGVTRMISEVQEVEEIVAEALR
jgi:hypothetical protein